MHASRYTKIETFKHWDAGVKSPAIGCLNPLKKEDENMRTKIVSLEDNSGEKHLYVAFSPDNEREDKELKDLIKKYKR